MKPTRIPLFLCSLAILIPWPALLPATTLAAHSVDGDDLPRAHPLPGSQRHYAPSRKVDVLHLAIDVTPDFRTSSVRGKATLTFKPIALPLGEFRFDGEDLSVSEVTASVPLASWHASREAILVQFADPVPPDTEVSVTVQYEATPKKGLYFRTPAEGYPEADMHIWTQGEPSEARHWFPCYDFPNEKFTSEVTCRVPAGMTVLSNGKKVSETPDPDSGLVAVRWLQNKPHVNYLITLIAGRFEGIHSQYKDIPMAFYTPPSQIAYATNSFDITHDMMSFFEEEIGVPYPWDKYDQVCVLDFHWGGMENTSQTTLNLSTLHTEATENLRSSQGLVAHELAHQWFGDLITCKDWSHIWLNEGFATYYEVLYDGHKYGPDQLLYRMYESGRGIMRQPNDTNSIVRRNFKEPEDQFGYLAYPKGSWILHMLRSMVGEDLYRQCIRTYVDRHQFSVAATQDLMEVFEELTGRSFDAFFDQYVFHAHHPELSISHRWDGKTKLLKLSVKQTQKLGDTVLLFAIDLPVRFHIGDEVLTRHLSVTRQEEDFYMSLPSAPEIIRIDPDLTLLARIDFKPSADMLHKQLALKEDMLGRLIAADALGDRKEKGAVDKLRAVLNEDAFHGVRIAASGALRAIGSDEAYEALTGSINQADARVRERVLRDVAGFYRESTYQTLLQQLQTETNPDLQAQCLEALGAYAQPEVRNTLLTHLLQNSFRNRLADAAIQGIRGQDDASYVDPLLQYLTQNESRFFFDRSLARALDTLGFIARDADDKSAVLAYLMEQLENPKDRIRSAAIGALSKLGEPSAIAALETFLDAPDTDPQRRAAEAAIEKLRESRTTGTELNRLRSEVMSLQNENRDLRKEFDDLKKQVEALGKESSN